MIPFNMVFDHGGKKLDTAAYIELLGGPAIGKTSLARLLADNNGAVFLPEVRFASPLPKPADAGSFLANQRHFLAAFAENWKHATTRTAENPSLVISDSGLVQILIHTKIYPLALGFEWDVFSNFTKLVRYELRKGLRFPTKLIYLSGDEPLHRKRASQDPTRRRSQLNENLILLAWEKKLNDVLECHLNRENFLRLNADVPIRVLHQAVTQWNARKKVGVDSLSADEVIDLIEQFSPRS